MQADAVESTKYIADSAQQAYLEAEPGSRGLIESYYQRYLGFSHAQVSRALEDYDSLSRRLGAVYSLLSMFLLVQALPEAA